MSSSSGQPSSRDGNNKNNYSSSSSSSLIQQELEEQKRREAEIAAMYQARQQQQQSSSNDVISGDKPADRVTAAAAASTASSSVMPTSGTSTSVVPNDRSHRCSATTHGQPAEHGRTSRDMTSFSSPGEALVYREMIEHRRRESELRRYWKELGYELPVVSPAADDEDADLRVSNEPEVTSREKSEPQAVNGKSHKTSSGESGYQQRGSDFRESKSRDQKLSAAKPEVIVIDKQSMPWSRPTEASSNDVTSRRRSSEKPPTTSGVTGPVQRTSASGLAKAVDTNGQITTGRANDGGAWLTGGRKELETGESIGELSDVTTTSSGRRGSRRSRTEAELIIEREVVEARKREAELRKLRETLTCEQQQQQTDVQCAPTKNNSQQNTET